MLFSQLMQYAVAVATNLALPIWAITAVTIGGLFLLGLLNLDNRCRQIHSDSISLAGIATLIATLIIIVIEVYIGKLSFYSRYKYCNCFYITV